MRTTSYHDRLAKVILDHIRLASLTDGATVCNCKRYFKNDRQYAVHVAEMVIDEFGPVLQQERVEGQLSLLAAAIRHFGPSERGTTARSRTVYTGAQFAGWCRERAHALHRSNGQGKPPTHSRSDHEP